LNKTTCIHTHTSKQAIHFTLKGKEKREKKKKNKRIEYLEIRMNDEFTENVGR